MALALRLFSSLRILLSRDVAQKAIDFSDGGELVIDDYGSTRTTTEQRTVVNLVATATDQAVPFGGVTNASFVLLYSTSDEVLVKLNGSDTAIPMRSVPAASSNPVSETAQAVMPGVVLWFGKVTSISLTNPDLVKAAQVEVLLVGEAA